jgi:hypothetical protein
MAESSTANIQEVSEGFTDGLTVGSATTDKVGFYGVTPVVQQTITTTNACAATGGATTTVLAAAIHELQVALGANGLTCTNQ